VIFEDDWIRRQVRILSEALARMTTSRYGPAFETIEQVDDAYGELFGIPADLLDAVDARTAAQLVPARQLEELIALLEIDAVVASRNGDEARAARRKALAGALRVAER
jgi:hypothetical protein